MIVFISVITLLISMVFVADESWANSATATQTQAETEVTLPELKQRLDQAERWLKSAQRRPLLTTPFSAPTPQTTTANLTPTRKTKTIAPVSSFEFAIVSLHYRDAVAIAAWLGDHRAGLLSKAGVMRADKRDNAVLIRDTPRRVQQAKRLLKQIDQPRPQFLIRAKLVSVNQEAMRTLGTLIQLTASTQTTKGGLTMDLPAAESSASILWRIPILSAAMGQRLSLALSALEKMGRAHVMASPRLMVLDGDTAEIAAGEDVPYQQNQGNGATSTQFKKAELRLRVTPYALPHHGIRARVVVNQDKVSALVIHGVPAIHTQRLTTQLRLNDRQQVVIGGIVEKDQNLGERRIPILHRLPLIGRLFTQRQRQWRYRDVLIMLSFHRLLS